MIEIVLKSYVLWEVEYAINQEGNPEPTEERVDWRLELREKCCEWIYL